MNYAIETIGLTHRYGAVTAVHDLNLQVPLASIFGFLGPNGSGKTTTIRMLLGLLRADRGSVHLFGAPFHPRALRDIGTLVEMPSLYPHLTARENLEVTRHYLGLRPAEVDRALAIVGLTADSHRPVKHYSLGMRQRLGLALALLGTPRLLILDEPTNGLDPAGIHEIRALLRQLSREHGITIFLASHLLSEVEQIATHVAILRKGQCLFQGPCHELPCPSARHLIVGSTRRDAVRALLRQHGWNGDATHESEISIALQDERDAGKINELLVRHGLPVHRLETKRLTLEEVFLELTGVA